MVGDMNTFNVEESWLVSQSMLLFAVEKDTGIHVMDFYNKLDYVYTIQLEKWNLYWLEDIENNGPLQIY